MITVLVFIRKLPELSMEQFIQHYEEVHAPLAENLLGKYQSFLRHYMTDGIYPEGTTSEFDVVTKLVFASEERYQYWLALLADPAIRGAIYADELKFLDSSYTRMWRVDERQS